MVVMDPEIAALVAASAPPPPVPAFLDDGARLAYAQQLRAWSRGTVQARRAFAGRADHLEVPTRAGSVPAVLYRPAGADSPGVTVWLHGGGMVLGDLDKAHHPASELAEVSGAAVLAVAYRLAPEHPFPAGPQDAYDALAWVAGEASVLGLGAGLAVGGESAGATMAACAALLAVREGGPRLAFQLLAYPKVDFSRRYPSMDELAADGIPEPLARFFDDCYLPDPALRSDPLASPGLADLTGMPAGLVLSAEIDTLRDEAEEFGRRLALAGTGVTTLRAIGQPHGFLDATAGSRAARRLAHLAYGAVGDALREAAR